MFGIDVHEYLRSLGWEQARGYLVEELEQLKTELRGRWNAALGIDNELNVNAISGDGTPATRYVANTGPHNKPKWDLVNLLNGVKNRLAFAHITQVSAGILLGRRSSSAGDLEEITIGPGLRLNGTVLSSGPTGGEFFLADIARADDAPVMMVPTAVSSGSSGITQLTGDVTAGPGSGSQAATLANSGVTPGAYGDATNVANVTVDAKGRVTAISNVPISGSSATTAFGVVNGRLTTESGVPVSITDRTAQATIYFALYNGNQIGLYDGAAWQLLTFTELSLALSSLTTDTNYDVFVDYNSGSPQLVLSAAWASNTTRTDAIALQDGIYVKSGTATYRHIGTIRTTGTTTTEDSNAKRFVWNRYNQVVRSMARWETAASWNYTIATWRQANANAANQLAWVTGDVQTAVSAMILSTNANTNATGITHGVAFGLDSTSVPNATGGFAQFQAASGNQTIATPTGYSGQPGLGYHFLAWLEASLATATTSWGGQTTFAGQTVNRGGMTGSLLN